MKNKHITRFGNPTTPIGARYCVSDEEGLFKMAVDFEFARLNREGVIITPQFESRVLDRVRCEQLVYNSKIANEGVPESLKALFQITKKSEAEKYCRKLTISEFGLFLLIHNCNQINFKHCSKFPEYVPDHLIITEEDRGNMKNGNLKSITRKIKSLFLFRRHIHVHLFQHNLEWHCFYFSYEDIGSGDSIHWTRGRHLHYVSHLWPNHIKEQIWDAFDIRSTKITGNIHIRFIPFEYSKPDKVGKKLTTQSGQPPRVFAFSASGCGSESIPTAYIATRGFLVVDLSVVN